MPGMAARLLRAWPQRAVLVNIEITRDNDLTTITRLHFSEQLFGRGIRGVDLKIRVDPRPERNRGVIQNQESGFCLCGEFGKLGC